MAADHYSLLGVPKDATTQDIKRAFRRIARECHPDVAGDDPERIARFHDARMAYEILMDPVTRARYDRRGQRRAPAGGGSFFDAFYRRTGEMAEEKGKQNERSGARVRGGGASNDIGLDDLLGGFGGGRSKPVVSEPQKHGPAPAPGRDIELELEVPSEVATEGGAVTATYHRMRRADQWTPGDQDPGLVRIEDICEVRITPKTADGTIFTQRGMGDDGAWGGIAGDLRVRVRIVGSIERDLGPEKPSDQRVDLSLTKAILGGRQQVQTPQGAVWLTIPAGTSSHTRMRLREKGWNDPGTGLPTDHYVVFRIVVPEAVGPDIQVLLEQLADRLET